MFEFNIIYLKWKKPTMFFLFERNERAFERSVVIRWLIQHCDWLWMKQVPVLVLITWNYHSHVYILRLSFSFRLKNVCKKKNLMFLCIAALTSHWQIFFKHTFFFFSLSKCFFHYSAFISFWINLLVCLEAIKIKKIVTHKNMESVGACSLR